MRSFPRLLVWSSVALLVGILAATVWFMAQEPPPLAVARLPNGSELRLEAVTFGERHQYASGPRWRRLLAAMGPAGRRSSQGAVDPLTRNTGPGMLMLWTSRAGGVWSLNQERFVIVDEHGCEFDRGEPLSNVSGNRPTDSWAARRFPRRGEQVTLRIYPAGRAAAAAPLAEFTVRNPAPGRYPVWEGERLPATRRDADLTLRLTGLLTGLKENGPVKAPWWREGGTWSCATLRMTQNGRTAREWQFREITLTDATGNPSMSTYSVPGRQEGEWHFVCGGSLAPHETAWKVRAEYTRVAGFPATDLWSVKGVVVPGRGAIVRTSAVTARHGARLQLLGMTGPGAHWPDDNATTSPSPYQGVPIPPKGYAVHVQASLPGKEQWWSNGLWLSLVQASDDRGRKVPVVGGSIEGDGRHRFELKVPQGTKRLDLAFAMPKSRYSEFVARPTRR
jgi:hypothetical protein